MEPLNFDFTSDPANRFPMYDTTGIALTIAIDRTMGKLKLTRADQIVKDFPLIVDGEPSAQAITITQPSDGGPLVEIGTVDYLDQPQFLEDYPMNDSKGDELWKFSPVDGGIVVLDLRNLGRTISTRFHLEMVPVELSITGIYLRITTLKYFADSGYTPWYEQIEIPAT